jgi:SAM-dependent methyltransferase
MKRMPKPPVFIGSSSEGKLIAEAVFARLERTTAPKLWNNQLFLAGAHPLDVLERELKRHSFAVFVASPDDAVRKRDVTLPTLRDNLLLEFGMFVGALGKTRVFFICPDSPKVELPSDLVGVLTATYSATRVTGPLDERAAAVEVACQQLIEVIEREWNSIERDKDSSAASATVQYLERNDATPRMLADISLSTYLVFIGVSNSTLNEYLQTLFDENTTSSLPTECIEIFFARDDIGIMWERDFSTNILRSVYNIAALLTAPQYRSSLSQLTSVSFYQLRSPTYFGGSMFRFKNRIFSEIDPFSVLYVTFYMPSSDIDAKTSFTMRMTNINAEDHLLYRRFARSYHYLKSNSERLLQIATSSIWDLSATQWDRFVHRYPVYSMMYDSLVKFANVQRHHKVLEFCCGTARSTVKLATLIDQTNLTCIDNSSQMLKRAAEITKREGFNIRLVLVDARGPFYGSIKKEKFGKILVHFGMHSLLESISIHELATLWRGLCDENGCEIVFNMHNTTLVDPGFQYSEWKDPLRNEILTVSAERDHAGAIHNRNGKRYSGEEIIDGFQSTGFKLIATEVETFGRTMADRVAMWRVPAIFDSLVDYELVGAEEHCDIMECVWERVCRLETQPTRLIMFKFVM